MWFLQLSTFHAVSIIYDHVIKFFCLKSLLVYQLWTVWNCPLFQNDVPFDQPWDDPLNAEMMSSWVIKIEKFEGETTKLTIFTIKKRWRKNLDFQALELTYSRRNRFIGVSSRHSNPSERWKSIIKHLLFAFKSNKPTCSIWRIRTILFCLKSMNNLTGSLTVSHIN